MGTAVRILISTFGGYLALMGVEHGIGEILQGMQPGSTVASGVMIESWPGSPFFEVLSGEPALTVLPNLLVTGILAVTFSLIYFVWAVFWVERKRSGLMLMLITVPMLLFGAGIFPPILGLLIGAAAAWVQAVQPRQRRPNKRAGRVIAQVWPWAFALSLLSWLAMFPGVPVLNYFFNFYNSDLILAILILMFVLLGLALWSGVTRDRERALG